MIFSPCNICGSDKYREICGIKISPLQAPSKLVQCLECGFLYANPIPERDTEEQYYKKRYHQIQVMEQQDYWYIARIDIFKKSLREIGKFLKKGRLIDVGCGMGYFMDLAKSRGWEVKGVEISEYAVDYARNKLNLDVACESLIGARLEAEYFDAATMWNVLDQVYNPKAELLELNRVLKTGGYLFIRAANRSFNLRLFTHYNRLKSFFNKKFEPPPAVFHLYSFDKNSIKKLLELTGFSNIIARPEPVSVNNAYLLRAFGKNGEIIVRKILNLITIGIYFLSFKKSILSPSLFVIARKTREAYPLKNE